MHFSWSMKAFLLTKEMAPLGQISRQGCARQPWQVLVTSYSLSLQALQAKVITLMRGGS